jgi:Carbohydrate family 9 binding domain-like
MIGFIEALMVVLFSTVKTSATEPAVAESVYAERDVPLKIDAASPFWHGTKPLFMDQDKFGKQVPGHRTEIRTRWTKDNLYFLFICQYQQLHLKPHPNTAQETNELWNWDVAEVFLGSDFDDIKRYKEFEMSPQGEWVDLDIDLNKPHHEDGWTWNSGFEAIAVIDKEEHVWYAAMRIPFSAIDARPPLPGNTLRLNLFRSQGPPEDQHEIAWQAPMSKTFHVPERFGLLKLVK